MTTAFKAELPKAAQRIVDSDALPERKVSRLQILALRAFPSSPVQNAIVAAYQKLQGEIN